MSVIYCDVQCPWNDGGVCGAPRNYECDVQHWSAPKTIQESDRLKKNRAAREREG